MPKYFLTYFLALLTLISFTKVFAATTRMYDFNNTSDLNTYFNVDEEPSGTNINYGGLIFSGSVLNSTGYENIWTTKKGFIPNGSGDLYEISGYFYNQNLYGYGSLGISNTDINYPDFSEKATPDTGIGIVFHGGGGYFVNNGVYTEILWPPDLEDGFWYKFRLVIENMGDNNFTLTLLGYKADQMGNLISMKVIANLEVVNSDIGNASKVYSYFGNSSVRFGYIDNIEIKLTGPLFEEDGNPLVSTTTATNISTNSADTGGEVTNELGNSVSERGVCYGISPGQTTSGTCTSDGSGLGVFSSNLTNLNAGTLYYYRAFATNTNGTSYGVEKTFTTNNSGNSQENQNTFKKDARCLNSKPSKTAWVKTIPTTKNGKNGILLTWSQSKADKISIYIDNGTNKFPYVINKTKNDGSEFIPNVTSKQKIKILPYNGCRTGEYSPTISIKK